jgi:hypothetical protein
VEGECHSASVSDPDKFITNLLTPYYKVIMPLKSDNHTAKK